MCHGHSSADRVGAAVRPKLRHVGKRRTWLVSTSASAGAAAGSPTNAVETSPRKTPHRCRRLCTGSTKDLPSSMMGNATTPKFIRTIKTPCNRMNGGNGATARPKALGYKLTKGGRGAWPCLDGRFARVGCAAERCARLHNPDEDRQARDRVGTHLQPTRGAHLSCSADECSSAGRAAMDPRSTNLGYTRRGRCSCGVNHTTPVEPRVDERLALREDKEREKRHCVGHVEVRLR